MSSVNFTSSITNGVGTGQKTDSSPSPTKARDFEGPGGPETKQAIYAEANPGNDDVR